VRAVDRLILGQEFALEDFSLGLIDGPLEGLGVACSVSHRVLSPYSAADLEAAVRAGARRHAALFDYHEAPMMYDQSFTARFPRRPVDPARLSKNPNLFVFQVRNPFDQVVSVARAFLNHRRNPGITDLDTLCDFSWRMHKAWVIQVVEAASLLDFPFVFVNYDRLVADPATALPAILRLGVTPDKADLVERHIAEALAATSTDRVREFERSFGRALANDQRADAAGTVKSHVGNVARASGSATLPEAVRDDIRAFYADPRYNRVFEDPAVDIF